MILLHIVLEISTSLEGRKYVVSVRGLGVERRRNLGRGDDRVLSLAGIVGNAGRLAQASSRVRDAILALLDQLCDEFDLGIQHLGLVEELVGACRVALVGAIGFVTRRHQTRQRPLSVSAVAVSLLPPLDLHRHERWWCRATRRIASTE